MEKHLELSSFILIELNEECILDFHRILSNKEILTFVDLPFCPTIEDAHLVLEDQLASINQGKAQKWLIYNGQILVGMIGLYGINHKHLFASQSVMLLPQFQRQGIMKRLLPQFNEWFFKNSQFHRLEAQVHENNTASISLLKSLGYNIDGILQENFLIDGVFYNSYCFSILNTQPIY